LENITPEVASIIELPSELTIAQVGDYRQVILGIIANSDNLIIDDSNLKRIDTIGLQFLLAIIIYISSQNKVLTWCSQSTSITECIKQLGLNQTILTQYLDV
jgi:anti-anti-sigma regulatory factor